jgi:hypothetical protein
MGLLRCGRLIRLRLLRRDGSGFGLKFAADESLLFHTAARQEGIPQGLKPRCYRNPERPKAEALGYLEAKSRLKKRVVGHYRSN